jgi:SAM-dependent methyltransferase
MADPTRRFSSRVENYIRYRPDYPPEVIELLIARCGLTPDALVADIGSGTGLLAQLFLAYGCRVVGVEPNREMRLAGERLLAGFPRFSSVEGTAEATTLPAHNADLISAGQAFHWFDQAQARAEFARLLRPGGWVVLIWNDRRTATTPFLAAYEQLLERYTIDYAQVNHKRIDQATIGAFFAPGTWSVQAFENRQLFDFAGLEGRLLSSSYSPEPGHPGHQPMIDALHTLFDAHQDNGQVAFEYDTIVYYGRLQQT